MSHPTPSLEGMEIAIPPSSGNIEQETDEYGRTREVYARRPLPRTPLPKAPAKSVARRPVGLPPGSRGSRAPAQQWNCPELAGSKPLPPEPLRTRSPSPRRSWVGPPTGHQPSQKILRWMGAEVDIHDDRNDSQPQPGSLEGSYSSSVYSHDSLQQLSQRPDHGSRTRHKSLDQKRPTPRGDHRFSDSQTAQEYHRFARQLGAQPEFVDNSSESCRSRTSGISWHNIFPSRRRSSPPPRLSFPSQGVLGRPKQQQLESPYADERPNSAFESDSDDNDEMAKITYSIRGFFSRKRDLDLETGAKRQSYGEGVTGFFDRAKGRSAHEKEEEMGEKREQLRRDIKFIAGGRMGSSGQLEQ